MLNGRLYRAAFLPLLPVLIVVAFSLRSMPGPMTTTLASSAFQLGQAQTFLKTMAAQFPDRRPGSAGDRALAQYVARQFSSPAGAPSHSSASSPCASHSTFCVRVTHYRAQTIDGEQPLTDVIATTPGDLSGQIVVIAHRDAAAHGSEAELSGTAALLELADVLAERVSERTITLVSTDGGSGGDAGAARLAREVGGPIDAVLVLGDLAGTQAQSPFVVTWSDGLGSAPPQLQRTIDGAVASQVGVAPGQASFATQFAHLAFPFTVGEQGAVAKQGLPAVLVQVSGERGPAPDDPVSYTRLANFGRAMLTAIDALDVTRAVPRGTPAELQLHGKLLPAWPIRLLVAALLAPALLAAVDALARVQRRREPLWAWLRWVLSCALPFFTCALLAELLVHLGILHASPRAPVLPRALPYGSGSRGPLLAMCGAFVASWLLWAWVVGARRTAVRPQAAAAGVALLLVFGAVCLVVWASNPFAALLLVPALHLSLIIASPELRPRAPLGLMLIALGLAAPAAVLALYAHQLALGPLQAAWTALLLLAGGEVGLGAGAVWSVALGCLVAATLIALRGGARSEQPPPETALRGPVTYAGPGSLGGTESALRR